MHSQVAPVAAGIGEPRVAYVQVAGGALPVSLSDAVRPLEGARLSNDPSRARCLDGDVQCAGVAAALLGPRGRDDVVIAPSGLESSAPAPRWDTEGRAAEVANVARALDGEPILAARVSVRD